MEGGGGGCHTYVASRNFDRGVRFVTQNHVVMNGVNRRPAGKEDCILEHGRDILFLGPLLLVEEKCGSYSGAFGVPDDGIKGAFLLHGVDQELERIIGAAVCCRNPVPHKLSHRVLGCLAVGEISDPC